MSNYPPGVTGREYQISGPDFEEERDIQCPNRHTPCMVYGFGWDRWAYCFWTGCEYFIDNEKPVSFEPMRSIQEQDAFDAMLKMDQEMDAQDAVFEE